MMTRVDKETGTVFTALLLVIFITLSCSKGYGSKSMHDVAGR